MSRHLQTLESVGHAVEVGPLVAAATKAAGTVRVMAARQGDMVGIRVMQRANGVRITVSGPKAHRYRAIVNAELERLQPQTKADVAAGITRKIR